MDRLVSSPDRDLSKFALRKTNERIPIHSAFFQSLIGIGSLKLVVLGSLSFFASEYIIESSSFCSNPLLLHRSKEFVWLMNCEYSIAFVPLKRKLLKSQILRLDSG